MSTHHSYTPLNVYTCLLAGHALIEASAGTGKTWAICGLVLRLIAEKGLAVNQILVVTFTKAATAELRTRIRERLVETLAALAGEPTGKDPFVPKLLETLDAQGLARDVVQGRLQLALATFDEAAIFTIHGFCQRALSETPFAAAQPFAVELIEDDSLTREVVLDFWRQQIAGGNFHPAFAAWLANGALTPDMLQALLTRQLAKPLAESRWPDDIDTLPAIETTTLNTCRDEARSVWLQARTTLRQLLADNMSQLNGNSYKTAGVDEAFACWDDYFAGVTPSPQGKAELLTASKLQDKTKKNCTTPQHAFFELADALIGAENDLQALFAGHRLALFRQLLDWGREALQARKRERRLVSYDDLLQNLYRALHAPATGPHLAATLLQRYPAALIDEFQDTDPLQFSIFQQIYAPCAVPGGEDAGPLFLVGDPKQAIYSFRQADLHTYLAAKLATPQHYALADNQRSDKALIEATNTLFLRNDAAFMLEGLDFNAVGYGAKKRNPFLDNSRSQPDNTALYLWELPEHYGPPDPETGEQPPILKSTAMELAGRCTAQEIARLLAAGRQGKVTIDAIPLKPADIAVLVRTHRQGKQMKRLLAEQGVTAAELSHANVFHTADAEELERLLIAIAEPGRTDLLRAALSTSLLGFTAHQIADLDDDEALLTQWIERLQGWQERWLKRGIIFALRQLFEAQGLAARLLSGNEGERRLTNLRQLGELLHHAETEHAGPTALLRWFADARRNDSAEEARQMRLESDEGLVRIITIHKSKGLEYPVVFCPFIFEGGIIARSDGIPGATYHRNDGTAIIDFRDDEATEAGKAQAKLDHAAEILRLYYVALTRAVHRAYLVCGCYGKAVGRGKPSLTESSKSLLNWLVAGQGISPDNWLEKGLNRDDAAAALRNGWHDYARTTAAQICLTPLPDNHKAPHLHEDSDTLILAACQQQHRAQTVWRIDSFTGLMRGATLAEAAASDHDAHSSSVANSASSNESNTPPELAPDDVLYFPRGAQAGDCIHHVFELADFTQPETWPGAIEASLRAFPPAAQDTPEAKEAAKLWPQMLHKLLAQVLHTRLPDGIELAQVSRQQRLVELEFDLPAPHLTAERLQQTLAALGYPLPSLNFRPLSGWLRGFVDLIFVHAGRYYVLDWKSNHLGNTPAAYGPGPVGQAMFEHGYTLQGLLYLVALHRYLQQRLPDYDPAIHLGGIVYLFVRGVRPDWLTANADGTAQASGVWFQAADLTVVETLDRLLTPTPA